MGFFTWVTSKREADERRRNLARNRSMDIPYSHAVDGFLQRNGQRNIIEKIDRMKPYIYTSFAVWPTFWLYRGLRWEHRRKYEKLNNYVHRTFLHAKVLQLAVLSVGLLAATREKPAIANLKETSYTRNRIN